ncbi:protein phosphatase 1L [Marchantia polymorpha subsp. ruderalis]|uniref:protein-serine/threonine phosphatase n=2 Tax=Marchantia polymorpha TaxID=3197 RepID=A0A176WGE6_MARPO|nr:hypothetical protein AXG93_4188s1070 [Marchantia polymorpha subsp. ruderalis]PTQ45154.1 hypothetical protein MARPO_0016s0194 [Marchantia polymorpha]BBN14420.1 hypothetical protein Mp_6g11540 [Marchantia polymorpha subsp. ruderalis]|eukprot:PTQ45154.1 hypothetical protein MARPO_0016s0194 [Marchantia polymorpha]
MSCVAVATSPALASCLSPSIRHREESSPQADSRSPSPGSSLDLMPSSVLVSTPPKLSPMISIHKPSSALSPITLASPRVLCSPKTPSWTSPIGTPTTRSSCSCASFSICSSCSCTLASASPGEVRWRAFQEKRESHSDVKSGASAISPLEGPSSRMGNGISSHNTVLNSSNGVSFTNKGIPSPRFSSSTSQPQSHVEAPSPRFGGCNNLSHFSSPKPLFSRVSHAKIHPSAGSNESENKENAGGGNSGSWIFGTKDLFSLDIPKDQEDPSEPLQPNVGESTTGEKDVVGHSGRPSTPPLKRKRPPKLKIPAGNNVVPNMMPHGVDLNEDAINEMTFEGPYFGISCKKGRREHLEDIQRAIPDMNGDPRQAFFGVFDGHGGRKAADFAAENLVHNIVDAMESSDKEEGYMEAAVRAAYLTTDADFLKKGVGSGTSCVTAIMRDGYMVVANAGDCRAVLSRDGQAEALTSDHRAGREDERNRIEKLGGYVDNLTGTWRVQGVLAVSRGIGDIHLKEWISAEPEVQKLQITSDCEFLILASDGLWDAVSNQEAVDFARVVLQAAAATKVESESTASTLTSGTSEEGGAEGGAIENHSRLFDGQFSDGSPQMSSKTDCEKSKESCSTTEDEVDIFAGTFDIGVPETGIPETPAPSAGPVAACKRLLEIAIERGCHDDISVLIVDLQHFCKSA